MRRLAPLLPVLLLAATGCRSGRAGFCGTVRAVMRTEGESVNLTFGPGDSDAERQARVDEAERRITAEYDRERRLLDDLDRTAPGAVRDDVRVITALSRELARAVHDGDLTPPPADPVALAAAERRVRDYTAGECGVALDLDLAGSRQPALPEVPPIG